MLKSLVKKDRITISIKVTAEELEELKKRAAQYARGNLSEWLRYSGTVHKPKKSELA